MGPTYKLTLTNSELVMFFTSTLGLTQLVYLTPKTSGTYVISILMTCRGFTCFSVEYANK